MRQQIRTQVAGLTERLSGAWRAARSRPETATAPVPPEVEARLAAMAERLAHVETALEGLQDAVYRQSVLQDERHADLRERTDPAQLARDLDADARRRGL